MFSRPTHTKDFTGNSRSSMLSKTLPLLVLVCAASALNIKDKNQDVECFHAAFPDYNTTIQTSTFDVRIEHSGPLFNIGSWFDSGDIHTIREGEIYMYNTTAGAMNEICEVVDAFYED